MSRDDSVIKIRLRWNNKWIWVVLHVSAVENFTTVEYILWYLSTRPFPYSGSEQEANDEVKRQNHLYYPEHHCWSVEADIDITEKTIMQENTLVFCEEDSYPSTRNGDELELSQISLNQNDDIVWIHM